MVFCTVEGVITLEKRCFLLGIVVLLAIATLVVPSHMVSMQTTANGEPEAAVSIGCSHVIIGKDATADGSVIHGHTEDLGENVCAHLHFYPRMEHMPGEVIHFAWEDVPQVPVTYAYSANEAYAWEVYSGFPFDGMNEYGVSMGCNSISSKVPSLPPNTGLSLSEVIQLVFERSKTAREAVDVIAWAVETYGVSVWGDCSYLLADANEGWLVETAKRHWVALRCPDDGAIFYANQMKIETEWDLACDDLIDYAIAMGWYDPASGEPFNFRETYGTNLGSPRNVMREERERALLEPKLGSITVQDVMSVLRDHYEGTEYYFYPPHGNPPEVRNPWRTICSRTTQAPHVWHLRSYMPVDIGCVMWYCMSSACISVFTPVYAGHRADFPVEYTLGQGTFDPESAWWTFEQIQRMTDKDYAGTIGHIRKIWDQCESQEFKQTPQLEKAALIQWVSGHKEQAQKLLTEYTNTRLHIHFLKARALLQWVSLKVAA